MRFAIVGAGAIGAFLGAVLARAGEDVTLIARGPHLRAMQQHGVRVRGEIGDFQVKAKATDDIKAAGEVDVVILTLKTHSVPSIAAGLRPLLGPDTSVLTAQNGFPWWYFYRHGGEWEGTQLESVDPGGVISQHLDPARVVGCVVYPSTEIVEPGVVLHTEGTRFAIGEPDGSKSERCRRIAEVFINAGLRCPVRTNLRHDIWVKLMGNVAYNPISALSGATLRQIVQCRETRDLAASIMREAETVAGKLGIDIGITIEQRLEGAEKVGHHKTSMLQDIEAGKPTELEAIVGAVIELGDKLGVELPHTKSVYACVKLLEAARNRN